MPSTGNHTADLILIGIAAVVLLFLGYRLGRLLGALAASKAIAGKEQELFTAQKGFKNLYEQEINKLKEERAASEQEIAALNNRVDDYRKKAAGFGLFSGGGKRADAMYALLLENEALEEALYAQNEKLRAERAEALREQLRSTGYRRVLMSQILNDERIKGFVAEILADEKHLPPPDSANAHPALPPATTSAPTTTAESSSG